MNSSLGFAAPPSQSSKVSKGKVAPQKLPPNKSTALSSNKDKSKNKTAENKLRPRDTKSRSLEIKSKGTAKTTAVSKKNLPKTGSSRLSSMPQDLHAEGLSIVISRPKSKASAPVDPAVARTLAKMRAIQSSKPIPSKPALARSTTPTVTPILEKSNGISAQSWRGSIFKVGGQSRSGGAFASGVLVGPNRIATLFESISESLVSSQPIWVEIDNLKRPASLEALSLQSNLALLRFDGQPQLALDPRALAQATNENSIEKPFMLGLMPDGRQAFGAGPLAPTFKGGLELTAAGIPRGLIGSPISPYGPRWQDILQLLDSVSKAPASLSPSMQLVQSQYLSLQDRWTQALLDSQNPDSSAQISFWNLGAFSKIQSCKTQSPSWDMSLVTHLQGLSSVDCATNSKIVWNPETLLGQIQMSSTTWSWKDPTVSSGFRDIAVKNATSTLYGKWVQGFSSGPWPLTPVCKKTFVKNPAQINMDVHLCTVPMAGLTGIQTTFVR